jgi:hypothetical protein
MAANFSSMARGVSPAPARAGAVSASPEGNRRRKVPSLPKNVEVVLFCADPSKVEAHIIINRLFPIHRVPDAADCCPGLAGGALGRWIGPGDGVLAAESMQVGDRSLYCMLAAL